jgi:hypothetical protein
MQAHMKSGQKIPLRGVQLAKPRVSVTRGGFEIVFRRRSVNEQPAGSIEFAAFRSFQYTGSPIREGSSLPGRSMQTKILLSRAGSATENRYGRSAIQTKAGLRREAQASGSPLSARSFLVLIPSGLSAHSADAT